MSKHGRTDMEGQGSLPRHVAIIMDGNGRWAKARGLPRYAGHRKGAEAVKPIVRLAADIGVEHLTFFAFSAENWSRPEAEVDELMRLLRLYLRSEIAELHKNGVRVSIIGDRSRLDPDIVAMIEHGETLTSGNSRIHVSIALNYGGRQDIVQAARTLAGYVAAGEMNLSAISEQSLSGALYTAGTPDPDLVIRSSGEKRISNFLLWQSAYTEMVFVDTLWPDFSEVDFRTAIGEFQRRDRRYGASASGR